MKAVLCATDDEAMPLATLINASDMNNDEIRLLEGRLCGETLLIAVCGMGGERARRACRHIVEHYGVDCVINLGICGALSECVKPGDVLTTELVIDGERDGDGGKGQIEGLHPKPWPGMKSVSLCTVVEPVFDGKRRRELARRGEVVDMEGWAVADECARLGVTCMMLKGVSDNAEANGRSELHDHIHTVSRHLALQIKRDWPRLHGEGGSIASRLSRLTRVEHTIFSVPLLFAGAWLGSGGAPSWLTLALIVVVGLGARTFGMAMNRILDRDIDAMNPRTAARELPAGRLDLKHAYAVAVFGLFVYLLGCAGLGPLCLYLSPIPLIPLAAYALLKRFTPLCHLGVGLCLAMAPMGAFVAASGLLPVGRDILLLAAFTLFWISGFDIIYALQDLESDRATGVRSLPASLGPAGAQAVAAVMHMVAVSLLVILWQSGGKSVASGAALGLACAAFAAAYLTWIPLPQRFFPVSAVACIAGSLVVILGGVG